MQNQATMATEAGNSKVFNAACCSLTKGVRQARRLIVVALLLIAGCHSEPAPTSITLAPDPARQWPAVTAAEEGATPAMAELRGFDGHKDEILALAVSPGGARLASVSRDQTLRLWEVATGNLLQTVELSTVSLTSDLIALFTDQGRQLLLANDKAIMRINLQTALIEEQPFALPEPLLSLAISSDDKWLALVGQSGTCQLLTTDLQASPIPVTGVANRARAVTFFPDGKQLLVGVAGEALEVFQVEQLVKDRAAKGTRPVWSKSAVDMIAPRLLAVSDHGQLVAALSDNHTLRSGPAPEVKDQNILTTDIGFSQLRGISYLPGGRYLAAYGGDCLMRLCDTQDVALAGDTSGASGSVSCGMISPGAQFAVSGYRDGKLKTFSMPQPSATRPDYVRKMVALRDNRDFDALERLVEQIRTQRLRKAPEIDHPLLFYFYSVLSSPDELTPEAHAAVDTFIADYRVAKPESAAAMVLEARRHIQAGWRARGSGAGFTVTPEGAQTFQEELELARRLVLRAIKLAPNDPATYAEMILVCKGTGDEPPKAVHEYLQRGMEVDPLYYPLYEMMADYLLPRWYGEPGEVERWALKMADAVGGEDGLIVHARIALRVLNYESYDYLKTGAFSLDKLKEALPALRRRYSRSLPELNFAAMIACLVEDRATAHAIFSEIGEEGRMDNVWRKPSDYTAMMRWADPATAKSQEKLRIEVPELDSVSMAFTPEGNLFVGYTSGYDSGFLTFDGGSGAPLDQQRLAEGQMRFIRVSASAKRVAFFNRISGADAFENVTTPPFVIWNREADGQPPAPLQFKYPLGQLSLHGIEFSPDESTCFFFDGRGQWHVCESDSLKLLHSLDIEFGASGPRVALNNHQLLIGTQMGELILWDFNDKSKRSVGSVREFHPQARIEAVARMPDGSGVIVSSAQAGLFRLKLPGLEMVAPVDNDPQVSGPGTLLFGDMLISPDGKWLVGAGDPLNQNGSDENDIGVWDAQTLKFVRKFSGHLNPATALCFSADGKTLASAADDRSIRLWDMQQVKPESE